MAQRDGRASHRVLRGEAILQHLDDSDFGESDDDTILQPDVIEEGSSNDSSSSSGSEEEYDVGIDRGSRPTRGRPSRGTLRGRRGRPLGSRASQSSVPTVGLQWLPTGFAASSSLMEPAYLPTNIYSADDKLNYFDHYIDDSIFFMITQKSNQTSVAKTGKSLGLTLHECKVFFGITVLMSCINYPIIRMYWEIKWRVPCITDAMTRDRYFSIRNSLKLVYDDDITSEERARDKLWKVRPLLDSVTKGCRRQVPSSKVAVDEMMIPFTGNCGLKQYCPNKPNPTGLKAFVLANVDGLVLDMVVYQGKTTFPELTELGFGLGESAVLSLTASLVPGTVIYCDRYFTSVKLLETLLERGIKCTGTLMKNRVPAAARSVLECDNTLKAKGRGSFQVLTREDKTMALTKWFDNKPVLMLSSTEAANVIDQCQRWSKKEKQYVTVDRPEVIKGYNSNMGGVDMADRLLAVCPSRARTRKWPVRFISHMFDLAITNSWIEYKRNEIIKRVPQKKIQQLRFYKMDIGLHLIDVNLYLNVPAEMDTSNTMTAKKRPGHPGAVPIPSKISRNYSASHMPEVLPKQQRCRRAGCDKRSTIMCLYCNVALCLNKDRNCFRLFHDTH